MLVACVLNSDAYTFGLNLNKLYDYFAAGRPVLFSGEANNDDITSASCGYSICPESPEVMAEALFHFSNLSSSQRALMGSNARAFATREYDIDHLAAKMEDTLIHLANLS